MQQKTLTVAEIADIVGGQVVGDADISRPQGLFVDNGAIRYLAIQPFITEIPAEKPVFTDLMPPVQSCSDTG